MGEAVAVQHVEGFAHRPQPEEGQRVGGGLVEIVHEQRQDLNGITQRPAFDPGHERRELVLAPLDATSKIPETALVRQV